MGLDFGLAAAYRQQDLCDSVADVVPHQVAEQQQGNKHTHSRKEQVLDVVAKGKAAVQEMLYAVNAGRQQHRGEAGADAHDETEQQQEAALRDTVL